MASEQRKRRDLMKLERFKRRVAGRQCAVEDCIKHAAGGSRHCNTHRITAGRFNNPLGSLPELKLYAEETEWTRELMVRHKDHPGLTSTLQWLAHWQTACAEFSAMRAHEDGCKTIMKRPPAWLVGCKLIERGISLDEWLLSMASVAAYLCKRGLSNEQAGELAHTIGAAGLRRIGNLENKAGKRAMPWGIIVYHELAQLIEQNLMSLLLNMSKGVDSLKNLERLRAAVARSPFRSGPAGFSLTFLDEGGEHT